MAVEIKELIIQGKVNKSSEMTDVDLIKLIKDTVSKQKGDDSIKETVKRQIVEECLIEVLKELETKLGY
ncbi:hypothetical protein N9P53_03315 [Flavobacteriaceae bacterium]|jgi:hypothetical protein|nr:hypothetical protein [Flavobacteriaceae bacterium]|tara:strand:- start:3285 stop:3491 length:207 start_codon:yes stop_codon:yes gene_type:complete